MLQYLLTWDYQNPKCAEYVGHPINGLFTIDVMIKNIQDRILQKKIPQIFLTWYCWNGTKIPCKYNKLPLRGNDIRNSGLVFQSDDFKSVVTDIMEYEDIAYNGDEIMITIPIVSSNTTRLEIIFVRWDDIDYLSFVPEIKTYIESLNPIISNNNQSKINIIQKDLKNLIERENKKYDELIDNKQKINIPTKNAVFKLRYRWNYLDIIT